MESPEVDGDILFFGGEGDDSVVFSGVPARGLTFFGGAGDDLLSPSALYGLAILEQDLLSGVGVTAIGGDGNDSLTGSFGNDVLDGGRDNDVLRDSPVLARLPPGSGGRIHDDDVMNGGDGDDLLISALGNDVMLGGDGNDIFLITGSGIKIVLAGAGDDMMRGALNEANSDTFSAIAEWWLRELGDPPDWLVGEQTWLDGGDGNDVVIGGSASDVLLGGQGTDTLTGGPGQDTFVFNAPGDGPDSITDFTPGIAEFWSMRAASAVRSQPELFLRTNSWPDPIRFRC